MKKGSHHSIKTKKKISEKLKGNTCAVGCTRSNKTKKLLSQLNKGKNHPFYGKKHKKESKLRISLSQRGEKGNNYIDGRRTKYNAWKVEVRNRDRNTCQVCGKTKNKVQIMDTHHILSTKNFPELKYNIENGITLCRKCHKRYEYKIDFLLEVRKRG